MIITDYQFISVFLNQYDHSVTRFWYDFHGYPTKDNPYFEYWKKFVIKKFQKITLKIFMYYNLFWVKKNLLKIYLVIV